VRENRTKEQAFADDLDCDLYRLIRRAESEAVRDKYWNKVVRALHDARPFVRHRMHANDRARTS
jgi:hypothetical protein